MELIKQNTQAQIIKSILVIFLGSVLLAVSAKIKIPFYPVPMTMQTFVGLPVFSNSPERGIGLAYFTGPTMGYLIGFLSACFLASFVKLKDNYLIIFSKLILAVSNGTNLYSI